MSNYYVFQDLMQYDKAEFRRIQLPDGNVYDCVCIPVTKVVPGGVEPAGSGVRMPKEYTTKDGKKKWNISVCLEINELNDKFKTHPLVQQRYAGKAMPTHQLRVALSKTERESIIEKYYRFYQSADASKQPTWWNRNDKGFVPTEDERKKQLGYFIDNSMNMGMVFEQKQKTVQADVIDSTAVDTSMYAQAQQQVTPPYEEQQPVPLYMQAPAPKPQPDMGMFAGQKQDDDLPF